MSKPQPKPGATAFPAFRLGRSIDDEEEVQLGEIVAGGAAAAVPLPTKPVPDLSRLAPAWFLIGAGWSGKTTMARWLGGQTDGAGQKSCSPRSIRKTARSPPSSTASNSPRRTTRRRRPDGCSISWGS